LRCLLYPRKQTPSEYTPYLKRPGSSPGRLPLIGAASAATAPAKCLKINKHDAPKADIRRLGSDVRFMPLPDKVRRSKIMGVIR
jgi:hypothetical protein